MRVCSQGVARRSADAVSVRLGGVDAQPQAQLDGFKSRALRFAAPAQRHLYTTEWRSLNLADGPAGQPDGAALQAPATPVLHDLSLSRAAAVGRYLTSVCGVAPSVVPAEKVVGFGIDKPLAPCDTAQHRAMNRRVQFLVM